jgi:hypothetical protein
MTTQKAIRILVRRGLTEFRTRNQDGTYATEGGQGGINPGAIEEAYIRRPKRKLRKRQQPLSFPQPVSAGSAVPATGKPAEQGKDGFASKHISMFASREGREKMVALLENGRRKLKRYGVISDVAHGGVAATLGLNAARLRSSRPGAAALSGVGAGLIGTSGVLRHMRRRRTDAFLAKMADSMKSKRG